ncbi:beta-ketoacyl synthase N-terminal-like domain-containing protein [Allorhodopirellula heiligendammensis]|uniref:Phenolphthiocerol synthesis polyketide synthase type I Pks15/1 n=1 Tax=Allorhodopirellula heiligendammensis TaxID=2714739 RepID=A0A5C6C7E8_9BACT|nr:beta-ketoacyl synthase N-terminal-like domain-containing protein [Allorhodopirellula heiligendammensis]TWU18669.1 Phenolphthiocerol synthesis polyketide synthase type I Pks15/1 [Allorhodopirellula heiligendammensis]
MANTQNVRVGEPIAVIGRGCHLPGAAGLDAYWQLILSGRCTQAPLPPERLDRDLLYDRRKGVRNKTYADLGCLVEPMDFSNPGCRLPHALKVHPEPLYPTLAAVAFDSVDDAGIDPLDMPTDNLGVYIGHTRAGNLAGDLAFANYIDQVAGLLDRTPAAESILADRVRDVQERLISDVRGAYPDDCTSPMGASSSARCVSDALRASGPYMTFNAACASSTQALIQAVYALQNGRVDMAIAGGASYCHSDTLVLFSQAQSLSANGTRPWDAAADGLVVGEGYVSLLLCRLSDAIDGGYPVHAVFSGLGLSSDGKGKSLWAPRKVGQMLAINRAYQGDVRRRDVGYIEAHATSTQVGDATEIEAIAASYQDEIPAGSRIPIGSVKANIGHTLETAGIAGVLKCLLAIEHQTIPPVRHIETPNPKIDWDCLPLEVPTEARAWRPGKQGWVAGVNAFGIGGLNTHVVLHRPVAQSSVVPANVSTSETEGASQRVDTKPSERQDAIAIVGVGCVLPGAYGANDCDAFWQRLSKNESALSFVPEQRWNHSAYMQPIDLQRPAVRSNLGGVVQDYCYDWRRHKVPPKQIANASPLQFMLLDAVDAAVANAGIVFDESNRQRTGVVVGTAFGGEFSNALQMGLRIPELRKRLAPLLDAEKLCPDDRDNLLDAFTESLLREMPALLDETGSFTSSSLASRISKSLDLMGGAVAVDAGIGSSGAAMACCIDQLLHGDNDLMICVGANQDLGPSRYIGMTRGGLLGSCEGSDGIFPGEGCVVLLLQRQRDALQAGRPIHAIVEQLSCGYATAAPERSLALATQRLLERCAIPKSDLPSTHFDRHGINADEAEVAAVCRWSLRHMASSQGGVARDASQLVGHLDGGSMAVTALSSLTDWPVAASPKDPTTTVRRLVTGGSAHETRYQLLLREN